MNIKAVNESTFAQKVEVTKGAVMGDFFGTLVYAQFACRADP